MQVVLVVLVVWEVLVVPAGLPRQVKWERVAPVEEAVMAGEAAMQVAAAADPRLVSWRSAELRQQKMETLFTLRPPRRRVARAPAPPGLRVWC